MYSDEQIRQIILNFVDDSSDDWNTSLRIICKTNDRRFLKIALEMLQDNDYSVVNAALWAINCASNLHSPDYASQILPLLDHPMHWTNAIKVLYRIGYPDLLPRLIPFLSYPDLEARIDALGVIAALGHPQIFEICLSLINDADPDMRIRVCTIFGELKNPLAVDLLIDKLQDNEESNDSWSSASVNSSAARALGRIKDKRAVEALKGAVLYGSEYLSARALEALWEIGGMSWNYSM